MSEVYDMERKRPLEVRVRQVPGGITEKEAQRFGRLSADAFALVRVLFEGEGVKMHFTSGVGEEAQPMGVTGIFHIWLVMTQHLAGMEIEEDNPDSRRQVQFARAVLAQFALSSESDPASPSAPEGDTVDPTDAETPQPPR